jgi:hypothetical protein
MRKPPFRPKADFRQALHELQAVGGIHEQIEIFRSPDDPCIAFQREGASDQERDFGLHKTEQRLAVHRHSWISGIAGRLQTSVDLLMYILSI